MWTQKCFATTRLYFVMLSTSQGCEEMMYRQGDVGLTAQGSVDSLEEDAESLNQTVLDHMEKLCTFDREKTIEVCACILVV